MRSELAPRSVRIGDASIAPGDSRTVALALPGRGRARADEDALPAQVTVGRRPGSRLTVLAAPRGFEAAAVAAATLFAAEIAPLPVEGSIIVVPLLRPGGRFAAGGRPIKPKVTWQYPGNAGGTRRQREAFTVFAETCVGANAIVLLTAPPPGQSGLAVARGNLEDPRFRRLAQQAGVDAVVHRRATPGSLAAAAHDAGIPSIELIAPCCDATPASTAALLESLRRIAEAIGVIAVGSAAAQSDARRAPTFSRMLNVGAEHGGLAEIQARPGEGLRRGQILGQILPLFSKSAAPIVCPRDGLVLEAPTGRHVGVRRGANLFRLAVGTRSPRRTGTLPATTNVTTAPPALPASAAPAVAPDIAPGRSGIGSAPMPTADAHASHGSSRELRVGWVERIALPLLGIGRLKAKIDTGARTSALHVSKIKTVGTAAGPHRRPILELTIPHGSPGGHRSVVVRAAIRDYVHVKDTSGRSERRPVIETTFRLGSVERRIRVTLTDRTDMLFPMLIGRTALGNGIVVDPTRRYLVRESHPRPPPRSRRL